MNMIDKQAACDIADNNDIMAMITTVPNQKV